MNKALLMMLLFNDKVKEHHYEDKDCTEKWIQKIGEFYPMEKTEELRMAHCPDLDPKEFYVTMNMMRSDYSGTAMHYNMDTPEFYAMMAKDFLMDEDAKPGKLKTYMDNIPV